MRKACSQNELRRASQGQNAKGEGALFPNTE